MGNEDEHLDRLLRQLREIEILIDTFINDNSFYLNFYDKSWAASPAGQHLVSFCQDWSNTKFQIEINRKNRLWK